MSLKIGATLGSYEILSTLGAGGMGVVYRARDTKLGREVAIKVLPEELARDPGRLARFEREARVLAALNHPHIVTIYTVEAAADRHFIVMELVEGRSLHQVLSSGRLELDELVSIGAQMAEAVAAAHRGGVVHRDLKPGNVMVSGEGWVKVLDFGLAKREGQGVVADEEATTAAGAPLTGAGRVVGTLPYMAPEQVKGRASGPGTDLFALGVVLYEMATGRLPAAGESPAEIASSILRDTPAPPSSVVRGLPPALDRIVMRCLEKHAEQRYGSATELLEALQDLRRELDSGSGPDSGADLLTPAPARTYETPLVGREAEVGELLALLERTASGRGALVTLSGEPGVGKTRLAWELIAQARQRGFFTLVGNCYEGEGTPAFDPWVETLQSAARRAEPKVLRELLADGGPEIAKLLPELRRLFPDLPPALELPPAEGRRYLFRCFVEFLERSSRRQPLLLLLEDVHWADEPTLLLLQHVAPYVETMPLLILATYRDVELEVGRPLAASLQELVRGRLMHRIPLSRLPEAGVAAMLAALCGKAAPAQLVQAIHEETEGNPFFVEEVVLHLEAEGRLLDAAGEYRRDLPLSELEVPESVRLVIGKRLQRLARSGQQILTAAAVLGRPSTTRCSKRWPASKRRSCSTRSKRRRATS